MSTVEHTAPARTEGWARALFEGIDDAVFVHDLDGHILDANPAACERLGYTRAELLTMTTRDIDAPEFAAGFSNRLQAQLAGGHLRVEGLHRTRDGRTIPVDINTSAIVIDGRPAVLAVMRDITQRKQSELALQQQSTLFQSVLANMGDAVIVADSAGRFLVCNAAARRLYGLPDEDFGFQSMPPPFGAYLPDRVTRCPRDQLPLERTLRGESFDQYELFLRHAQAPQGRWASLTGRPLRDDNGQVRGGILVARDITRRKTSEQRQATQFAVTRVLAEATGIEEAADGLLREICEGLGWDVSALWVLRGKKHRLRCLAVWSHPGLAVPEFVTLTRHAVLPPGTGLPGVVWETGQPARLTEAATSPNFPRVDTARREGLRQGFAFPIRSSGAVLGVIETYNTTPDEPEPALLALMAALGDQIGQVLDRQRVTQALHDSEAFYQSLVESLPLNLFRKDREGRVLFGNQRYCNTLRTDLQHLVGMTDYDLFPVALAAKYRADDDRVMQTGQPLETVEEHLLPSGERIYVQVIKTSVVNSQGETVGTQGMFWDVTPRKRAEEVLQASEHRYRQLTESTLDAIVLADHQGVIMLFNPAAERLFGYSAAEAIGQPVTLLVPPQYREKHDHGFARYLATRRSTIIGRPMEMHGRRKDGSVFPMEIALSVIEGDGSALQFLGAIRDLTERNRIRLRLVQNEKMASIGLLSAGVAHEINNPLAFVGNNLAVLERDCKGLLQLLELYGGLGERLPQLDATLAAQVTELTEEIDLPYIRNNLPRLLARTRDGVDRVTRIVHSLRGLARTDSPHRQDTSIPDLVENSLEIIRGRLRRKSVQVELDYDPNSRVRCVSTQLSQVLLNLLVNGLQAIEATGRSEGNRLGVRTRWENDELRIEVSDNGCGIDPAHLSRLFDPFFTTKDVGEGTGLGLSISHNIVTAHDGRIEVDSEPGRGTTFRIYLPRHSGREDTV